VRGGACGRLCCAAFALRITDVEGGANVGLMAYNADATLTG